ncbi:MAG: c-type cytochrome [Myxococcales bacterium]
MGRVLASVAVAAAMASSAHEVHPRDGSRCAALIDLVISGYDDAVSSEGRVLSPDELADQRAIAAAVIAELRDLGADDLVSTAEDLERRIAAAQAPAQVVYLARKIQDRVSQRFGALLRPSRAPDRERGARLYRQACAACHGIDGRAPRGVAGRFTPPPPSLADPRATGRWSARQIYSAATVGVPQTAMPGFAEALTDDDRWDLAFHARSLAHPPPGAQGRRALERARAAGFAAGVAQLVYQGDDFLRLRLRAASLAPGEVEQALSALRYGPFGPPSDPGTPAVILPAGLVRARVFSDEVSGDAQQGLVVETRLLLLEPARPERRGRVDQLMDLVAQQLLWRSERPPVELTLSLYASEEDARAARGPVAFCILESEDDVDCENRIPLSFAEQLAHAFAGGDLRPTIAADERRHAARIAVHRLDAAPPSFPALARAFFEDALRLYQQAPRLAALTYAALWNGRTVFEVRLRDRGQFDALGFPALQQRLESAPAGARERLAADGYRQALSSLPPGSVRLAAPLRKAVSASTPRGPNRARCRSCR